MGTMSVGRQRVALLAVVVCAVVAAVAALSVRSVVVRAQQPVAAVEAIPVAVTDFINKSDYGGDVLGRTAADALVLAMDESERFEPLERAEVDPALARLGFGVSLGRIAQARLGEELEVSHVASGVVNDVHFEDTNEGRVAVVDLTVALLDVASGEYSSGARVTIGSSPRPGYTADDAALVDEALILATYQAVRTIVSFKRSEATVLSATPTDVYLNAGSRAGLKEGMELVVMRFGEKVGRLRVIEVEPGYATCGIIASYRGVTVGDKAFSVFQPPTTAQAVAARRAETKSKLNSTLISLLAAAGVFFTVSKDSPAEEAVPAVAASSLSDATGTRAGILVTWGPHGHQDHNVRAYEIWRNGEIIWVKPAAGVDPAAGGRYFVDEDMAVYSNAMWEIDLSISGSTGLLSSYVFDEPEDPDDPPPLGFGGASGESYNRLLMHTPPASGQQYIYNVVAIVANLVFGAPVGEEEEEEEEETPPAEEEEEEEAAGLASSAGPQAPPSKLDVFRAVATSRQEPPERHWELFESPYVGASSFATFVEPPPLTSPAPAEEVEDLTQVLFTWNAVAGADDYVLQIGRDAFFQPLTSKTYAAHDGEVSAGTELSLVVNVAQDFPPPAQGGVLTLRWRVGARNSRDLIAPRTDPALAQAFPQDQEYVWGTPGMSTLTYNASASASEQSGRAPRRLRWIGPRP